MKGAGTLVALAFLWSGIASAADLCRDDAGRFTACPESVTEAQAKPADEPPAMLVRATAGALTAVATDANASVQPLASLSVIAPLSKSRKGPSLAVQADLTALPGETVDLSDPQTFKALELGIAVVQPLGGPLLFSVYAEGGFASRLAVESEPVTRLPGWFSAGLLFATADGSHYLRVGMGPDQRLSGEWSPAVHVSGRAKVGERAGVSLYLVGSAIRAIDVSAYGFTLPARDSLRIGVSVGM